MRAENFERMEGLSSIKDTNLLVNVLARMSESLFKEGFEKEEIIEYFQKIVEIEVSPEFKRSLRSLAKRYRNIRSDIQPIIDALQAGNVVGDQIRGVGYSVFKIRIKNSNNQKGNSGGYRFIYYLKTDTQILLITIYSQ
jgi:mRNA-degrading endonuclease RelE of RelBE toxin-antitoxin system